MNLARTARVTVTGSKNVMIAPPSLLTDGHADLSDNSQRWLSSAGMPQQVELSWDTPQTFSAARLISGYLDGAGALTGMVETWSLQVHDGRGWREVPGAGATENAHPDWSATFAPQTATRVRLNITTTPGNIARIWEFELYNVQGNTQ